jgi:transcription antitermination protein NusB
MISRRLLRIKVLQVAYAYFKSDIDTLAKSEKELFYSIGKTYELYLSIFMLITELARYARKRIDLARSKLSPTYDDLNPNTRFVDNRLIVHLEDHGQLNSLLQTYKISWMKNPELIRELYNQLISSGLYQSYMAEDESSWQSDKKFILQMLE